MKTKIAMVVLTILMSVQILEAQKIIYGDKNDSNIELSKSIHDTDLSKADTNTTSYYVVDESMPNAFTTGNQTQIVCRLMADETNVICSTSQPQKGWGNMVLTDGDEYYYEDKYYSDGANIYSMAFTDPKNGWAVGIMDSHSVDCGVVFHTKDGGKSWNIQFKSGTSMKLNTVGFTDSNTGWAKGIRSVGNIAFDITLFTTDGGVTWHEKNLTQLNDVNGVSTPDLMDPADY